MCYPIPIFVSSPSTIWKIRCACDGMIFSWCDQDQITHCCLCGLYSSAVSCLSVLCSVLCAAVLSCAALCPPCSSSKSSLDEILGDTIDWIFVHFIGRLNPGRLYPHIDYFTSYYTSLFNWLQYHPDVVLALPSICGRFLSWRWLEGAYYDLLPHTTSSSSILPCYHTNYIQFSYFKI